MRTADTTSQHDPITFEEIVELDPSIGRYFNSYRSSTSRCQTELDMLALWLGYGPDTFPYWRRVMEKVDALWDRLDHPVRCEGMWATVKNHFLSCRPELADVPPGARHAFCWNDDDEDNDGPNW